MYLICGFAVYKVIQLALTAIPKEPAPWIKVLAGVSLGMPSAFIVSLPYPLLSGLAVATLASAIHLMLRLIAVAGDLAIKRSLK